MTRVYQNRDTSRVPLAPPLAMSTAQNPPSSSTTTTATTATPSPLPPAYERIYHGSNGGPSSSSPLSKRRSWPKPRMRLEVQDLMHPATQVFTRAFSSADLLSDVVDAVLTGLYGDDKEAKLPPVRSITLVLRSMDGVAYTAGNDALGDGDHKEIHFSLDHINNTLEGARKKAEEEEKERQQQQQQGSSSMEVDGGDGGGGNKEDKALKRTAQEIHGVLVHEMVHCWQWNGSGSAPGGLVEGIADFVRLKEGLEPPHWDPNHKGDKWDAGYQTTAYFLEWCEGEAGKGKVRECNAWLRSGKYKDDDMWTSVFGRTVDALWKEYTQNAY